jgi:hypothetical protein
MLRSRPGASLFGIAITSFLLLFIGIHNAWDTVTYIAVQGVQRRSAGSAPQPGSQPPGRGGRRRR